jgi:cytoskeleton protein RodZ
MNETVKDETEMASEVAIGPGARLRKARERQGLDRTSMAAQLHLSQIMIAALESDDFDNLPGPVFVQGYLRNYARLLNVNEDSVIASYQRLIPVSDNQQYGAQKREVSRELHTNHWITRYVTWGILLTLTGLLFFWWQNRAKLEDPLPLPEQEQIEFGLEGLRPVEPTTPQEVITLPDSVTEEVSEPESASRRLFETSEQVLTEVDELLSTPDQMLGPGEDASLPATEVVESTRITPTPQLSEPVEPVASAVSKSVLFLFKDTCWTEVRDREDKLRIFGELGSGMQRVLDSRHGPFSVILGNAPEVELTIDGEVFDLSPYTRGRVARFTLDVQGQ